MAPSRRKRKQRTAGTGSVQPIAAGRVAKLRTVLSDQLFRQTDIASLVYFRVVFGAILIWEVFRYFDHGWISRYYIDPAFHFTYLGFGWIEPWPGTGMYVHFILLGALALCIALGILRVSIRKA